MTNDEYRNWWKKDKLEQEILEKRLREINHDLEALASEMGFHGVPIGWKKGEKAETLAALKKTGLMIGLPS